MSEAQNLKEQIMMMAVHDVEQLFMIIGDLGFVGYKVSLCKLKGYSLQQCANKYGLTKSSAQYVWARCMEKAYDEQLKRIFGLK